jgi:hypothetical protein
MRRNIHDAMAGNDISYSTCVRTMFNVSYDIRNISHLDKPDFPRLHLEISPIFRGHEVQLTGGVSVDRSEIMNEIIT